jgi:hypothetical protein
MKMDLIELQNMIPNFPVSNCKQIVIGVGEYIILYIVINIRYINDNKEVPFSLFMPEEWNEEINLLFTQCAIKGYVNNCNDDFFIRILLPKNLKILLNKDNEPRITLLEICTISKFVKDKNIQTFIYNTSTDFEYNLIFI